MVKGKATPTRGYPVFLFFLVYEFVWSFVGVDHLDLFLLETLTLHVSGEHCDVVAVPASFLLVS